MLKVTLENGEHGWVGNDLYLLAYYGEDVTYFRGVYTSFEKARKAWRQCIAETGIDTKAENFIITKLYVNRLDGIEDFEDERKEKEAAQAA